MANRIFRGDAVPVAQVVKITPSNPEVGDTFTIKINGKQVDFVATDASVATVVNGLVAAWNSATFPEATLITANSVDSDGDGNSDYLTLTADRPGVPFRIETSTSDAGGFSVNVSTIQAGRADQNEKQSITLPPSTSGGTFTLTFSGQATADIAYNALAADVQTALESLSNIAPGDVIVTGSAGGPWTVEFSGNYSGVNVPLMSANGTGLTGAATVSIETITEGSGGTAEIQQINFSAEAPSASIKLQIHDPISGATQTMSWNSGWTIGLFQTGMNNAMGFLGTGGIASCTEVADKVFQVEFGGTWLGLNVDPMTLEPGTGVATNITTIQEGSGTGTNEVQRVALLFGPDGGIFTLNFNANTTAGIPYNASAVDVQTALEALAGAGNVAVTGNAGGPWTVTFQSAFGNIDVGQMIGNGSGLTGGSISVVTTQAAVAGLNELQQITLEPTPEGGTFTLTIDPGGGDETTADIAYDASAATVQAALEALASFASGDFEVTGDDGGPWVVEFKGSYAETDMNLMDGDGANLTGAGTQGLVKETLVRSQGPNHFDDPDNWTGESVPNSQDVLFFYGGKVDCLYGLKQRVTFTVDAGTDLVTFDELADFVEGQAVRLFTTNTLPAGISVETSYYIVNLDSDAGTCQLSLTPGGEAIDISDAGTGTHTIALHLAAIRFHSRWAGRLGLSERNGADYYEYLPRSLSIVVDTITIGEGEGDGQSRLDIDTGAEPTTLIMHQSGGSNEPGVPAIRWKGTNSANAIVIHDGEFGAAVYATEEAIIDTLVQHAGLVQMGTVTIGSLTKHGGELIAEDATLSGMLRLHA